MIVLKTVIENVPEFARTYNRAVAKVGEGCQIGTKLGCSEGIAEVLARRKWKDRTGEARKALRGYVTNLTSDEGAEGVMEWDVDYASYLDEGTVPHTIQPKAVRGSSKSSRAPGQTVRAQNDVGTTRVMLRWYDSGGDPVFRKVVHHPGTRGDGAFGAGVQKCERVMQREIELSIPRAQAVLDG